MRVLLISDTHGRLDHIDALATDRACEAVIHAGDLGFYDQQSLARLSEREVDLRIVHSEMLDGDKRDILGLPAGEKLAFVRERLPLSQLPQYLNGERRFAVPVYAVWGNHEDTEVVKGFYLGKQAVPNLHVLHERSHYRLAGCEILGVGGNLLMGRKFFQKPIAGGGGKVWTTLTQYLDLIRLADRREPANGHRILVSHVSPGKEPFVSLIGACVGASCIVSGHMGPPVTMCWNEFAIREPDESAQLMEKCLADICRDAEQSDPAAVEAANSLRGYVARCQQDTVHLGRGLKVPRWYRDMYYVNLPDCRTGHAVLVLENGSMRIESYTTGKGWNVHGEQPAGVCGSPADGSAATQA